MKDEHMSLYAMVDKAGHVCRDEDGKVVYDREDHHALDVRRFDMHRPESKPHRVVRFDAHLTSREAKVDTVGLNMTSYLYKSIQKALVRRETPIPLHPEIQRELETALMNVDATKSTIELTHPAAQEAAQPMGGVTDAMVETGIAVWKRETRCDVSQGLMRMVLRECFTAPPKAEVVQPVEAVDVRASFEAWATSAGYLVGREPVLGLYVESMTRIAWLHWQAALAHPRPTGDAGMVSVVAEDANNYCLILTELGMEEEGDPVAEVKRLAGIAERTHESSFQHGVATWMDQCFLPSLYSNMTERGDRLIEEVLELLQSHGYDQSRVATLVDYVYGRPVGEPAQEVGGVMVTLAGYCWVAGLDMHAAGAAELARITQPAVMAKIRAKQEAKNALHFDTPLPGNAPGLPAAVPTGAVALMSVAQNGDPIFQTIEGWNELSPGNHLLYAAPTGEQAAEVWESAHGYQEAFYKIAEILEIGAMPESPSKVFASVMLPMIRELVAAQPLPAGVPDEYLNVARLIGCIFYYGGFKAETFNERELEKLLRATGNWYESEAELLAAAPAPGTGGEA